MRGISLTSTLNLNLFGNGFYAANKRRQQADGSFRPVLAVATRDLGDAVEARVRDNGTGRDRRGSGWSIRAGRAASGARSISASPPLVELPRRHPQMGVDGTGAGR
jgi:hypothetical protein